MRNLREEPGKVHYANALKVCVCLAVALNLSALCQQPTPSVVVKGEVTTEVFSPWSTNSEFPTKADFLIATSNRFWEIELLYQSPESMRGTGESCMRIADGIRVRPIFPNLTNKALLPAVAFPIAYPQPGRNDPFACWLGLAPEPELPVLQGSRIRRFLDVKFQNDPRNEGTFAAEYLAPDRRYLRNLTITNNGALFTGDGKVIHYKGLLAPGFLELKYETTETTNWSGMTLPCRGILAKFSLKPSAKTPDDVYTTVRSEFKVSEIIAVNGNQELPRLSIWPSTYMALDKRFPDVHRSVGINYIVTNDAWNSATNADLRLLAVIARGTKSTLVLRKLFWSLTFLVLIVAPILSHFFISRRRRQDMNSTTRN